jgi:arginase
MRPTPLDSRHRCDEERFASITKCSPRAYRGGRIPPGVTAPRRPASVGGTIATAIAVQGWTCDRTPGGMAGSGFLAERAASAFGLELVRTGARGPVANVDWRAALDRAMPTLAAARAAVHREIERGRAPLVFLNRCGTSLATIPPVLAAHPDAVVVWVDAHGDYNTPDTTVSGYLGGMVVSALRGLWDSGHGGGLTADRVVLAGTRDLDAAEERLLRRDEIEVVRSKDATLDIARILRAVDGRPVVLHIDLDVVDPTFLPTEYAIAGGLHPATLRRLVRTLAESAPIVSLEVSEFDLVEDIDQATCSAALVMTMIEPHLHSAGARG